MFGRLKYPDPDTTTTSGRLQAARNLITPRGNFCSDKYGSSLAGEYCMLGALAEVQLGHYRLHESSRQTRDWEIVAEAAQAYKPNRPVSHPFLHSFQTPREQFLKYPEVLVWRVMRGRRVALKLMDRAIEMAEQEEREAKIRAARIADEAELLAQGGKVPESYYI